MQVDLQILVLGRTSTLMNVVKKNLMLKNPEAHIDLVECALTGKQTTLYF